MDGKPHDVSTFTADSPLRNSRLLKKQEDDINYNGYELAEKDFRKMEDDILGLMYYLGLDDNFELVDERNEYSNINYDYVKRRMLKHAD